MVNVAVGVAQVIADKAQSKNRSMPAHVLRRCAMNRWS